jgi:hypothetical protein
LAKINEPCTPQGHSDPTCFIEVIKGIGAQRLIEEFFRRALKREFGFLGNITNTSKLTHSTRAAVWFFKSSKYSQERRLSRAVGPDKADPVSLTEAKRESSKERLSAVSFTNRLTAEENRATHSVTEPLFCPVWVRPACLAEAEKTESRLWKHKTCVSGFQVATVPC